MKLQREIIIFVRFNSEKIHEFDFVSRNVAFNSNSAEEFLTGISNFFYISDFNQCF